MLEQTGCDGLMIGRGARGNPWIFREIGEYFRTGRVPDPPSPGEREQVMEAHFRKFLLFLQEDSAVRRFKINIPLYTKGLKGSAGLRKDLSELRDAASIFERSRTFFTSLRQPEIGLDFHQGKS